MNPSPEQILRALANSRQSPRTHGAKVRDAMMHVKNSQTIKTPGGHPGVGVPMRETAVTGTGELRE